MKILYSMGPRIGAGEQCKRILSNLSNHIIKVAGHTCNTKFYSNLYWNLDYYFSNWHYGPSIENIHKKGKLTKELEALANEIGLFDPDLIISDGEPLIPSIGILLNIPYWNCSSMMGFNGILISKKDYFYRHHFYLNQLKFRFWPKAERNLIYSPFSFISHLKLKQGFEWITPYSVNIQSISNPDLSIAILVQRTKTLQNLFKVSDFEGIIYSNPQISTNRIYGLNFHDQYEKNLSEAKWSFLTGETSFLTDVLQTSANIFLSPRLDDPETVLNSCMLRFSGLGQELGQIELSKKQSSFILNEAISKESKDRKAIKLPQKFIHQLL